MTSNIRNSRRRKRRRRHKWFQSPFKPIFVSKNIGRERKTYADIRRNYPGIYVIELSSTGTDARVALHLSEYYPYPLLPVDSTVKVTKLQSNEISVAWHSSPSESIVPIEYAVFLNHNKNLVSFCDTKQRVDETDYQSMNDRFQVTDTGFTHWWEKTANRLLAASQKLDSRRDFNSQVQRPSRNTWLSIKNLNANSTYFIDVVAINKVTNASSIYKGVVINTPPFFVNSTIKLKDNALNKVQLTRHNNYTQILKYTFKLNSLDSDRSIWIFVQSCDDRGALKISWRRNSKSNSEITEIFDFKTIEYKITSQDLNKSSSVQKMQFHLSAESEKEVNVLINKKHSKFPFPRLTSDRNVRILHSLTTHNSLTLAWIASLDDKVNYCIFQKQIDENDDIDVTLDSIQMQNLCPQTRTADYSSNRDLMTFKKLLCRRYNKFSNLRINDLIMQPINGLKASTKYVFAVKVSKSRRNSLYLDPVLVSTKSTQFF
ncbi:protein NDNF-like protein [Leptotrombidium deliense]|uniref:Protein NDNF-like protein n=1 Tax=Leptotrombidium deliense TaxID=299467 RepID=A0A443S9P8_9ACAR|nr:protein NDNF-like protein [Leptotrombidium deliense]